MLRKKNARTSRPKTVKMAMFVLNAAMKKMRVRKHHRIKNMPTAKLKACSSPP